VLVARFKAEFVVDATLFVLAFAAPSLPPWLRLQLRWAMPDPSSPGAISPVSDKGGSWSALGPSGCDPGSDMSTG
jgi:hypothetical protein